MGNLWQRRIRAALKPHDLTHVQFVLLANLGWLEAHEPGPVTQATLAERAATDAMMTSEVVRSLAEKGLIARAPHPRDRRAVVLSLTPEGVRRVSAAFPDVVETDRRFFAALGGEVEGFASTLDRLARAATQDDG